MQDYILRVRRGDSFRLQVTYENPDTSPINMTGYTLVWHIKWNTTSIDKTEASSGVVFTPLAGSIQLNLTNTETTAIAVGATGTWYLRVTDTNAPAGQGVVTLAAGPIEIQ